MNSQSHQDYKLARNAVRRLPVYYPSGIGPPASTPQTLPPYYPRYPFGSVMPSVAQRSQVRENEYLNQVQEPGFSANTLCEPGAIPAQDYRKAHPIVPEHSRDHPYPFVFSDEHPNDRRPPGTEYSHIIRRNKLWVSSLKKAVSTDNPENFYVTLESGTFKNVRGIRIVSLQCTYLTDADPIYNGFVYFPDFGESEVTSDGFRYHCYFPVITDTAGTTVKFNYVPTDYITTFKQLDGVKNKLRVKIYVENSTDGTIELFTDLVSFAIELELMQTENDRRGFETDPPVQ